MIVSSAFYLGGTEPQAHKALLLEVTNRPPQSPVGDAMDPAPIDQEHCQEAVQSGDVAAGPAEPPEPPQLLGKGGREA